MKRRFLLGAVVSGGIGVFGNLLAKKPPPPSNQLTLRPPGSLKEQDFLQACVRCFKCGSACPNGCISFHDTSEGMRKAFTPYIRARERGCILCGECAEVCPSGAILPFKVSREGWVADVNMGKAHVNKGMCFSYHGRTCGACYQACPLAGEAIKIGLFETPHVQPDKCVGCGLCEQACLHLPQAIRVIPRENLEEES
jgi:ferredoxin-type protein NapG